MRRLNEWESAFAELQKMHEVTQRNNAILNERVVHIESAGAALERADRTLEPVIQRELEIREERLIQEREHVLSLERERQPEIQERTLDGPSLGW
ncbi:MbeD/MobD family mobilization/exclusion protein [Escherichia coli]|uniref:MbeD/MobD family mobilization/exclusion protein n=1 Tax=Escherichia coli TaxID=562 RepID=UPI003D8100C8